MLTLWSLIFSCLMLERTGAKLGLIGLFCLVLLFLPISRGSLLLRLIDIPFEHATRYHVWLGHLTMAVFTIHGLLHAIAWALKGNLMSEVSSPSNHLWYVYICPQVINPCSFETFYTSLYTFQRVVLLPRGETIWEVWNCALTTLYKNDYHLWHISLQVLCLLLLFFLPSIGHFSHKLHHFRGNFSIVLNPCMIF